jgi:hypothetical protein
MSARQQAQGEALLSIAKKMEAMVEASAVAYEESLVLLGGIQQTMQQTVVGELQTQTKILTQIAASLAKGAASGGAAGDNFDEDTLNAMGKSLSALSKAANRVNAKAGDIVYKFLIKISDGFAALNEKFDEKKAEALTNVMRSLGWSVIIFAAAMFLATPLLIVALPGVMLFGLTIRLLMFAAGTASDPNTAKAMEAVSNLGAGPLWFALAMVAYMVLSPVAIIGAMMFGFTIRVLLWAAGTASSKEAGKGLEGINKLWKGVLFFGLAMAAYIIIGIPAMIGALFFLGTVFLTTLGLKMLGSKKVRQGQRGLLIAVAGIILLGLTMYLFHKEISFEMVLFTLGSLALTGILFLLLGTQFKKILKGAFAVAAMSLATVIFALGMYAFKQANMGWEDVGILAATIAILGIEIYIAGLVFTEIVKGSIAMAAVGISIIPLAIGMAIWAASDVTWKDVATLGVTLLMLGVEGALFGLAAPFVLAGVLPMAAVGASIIPLAIGMMLWTAAGVTFESVGTLGATILMLGIEFALFGLAAPFVLAGAAAMGLASLALLPLTASLAIFKPLNWKDKDGDSLQNALGSIVSGFLGGEMPGGILAAIKFAAAAAARAALLFITVPPMILAGIALIPITKSLKTFKETKFTKGDADNLEYMIGAVIKAFSLPGDTERKKKMGIHVSMWDLWMGISVLSNAGDTLASLAKGVQEWANLTVTEWEVVNPGTADAKLVPSAKRQLKKSDFELAAHGMATVISAIAKPFAEVGRLNRGESSGNPILDAIFGGGLVEEGVEALKKSGDTIVNLAAGVQAFANLTITEYEVVNAGTKDAILVPKSQRQMTEADIEMAGNNIATILSILAKELAKIGKMEKDSSGWFSGGYVTKGAEALAGVGDNIKAIADTVLNYANLTVNTFELVGKGTKDAKLVPGEPIKLTEGDLINSAKMVSKVLGVIVKAVAKVGKMEDNSSGWFSDGYVQKGRDALAGIGENIKNIADAVLGFATAQFTPMTQDKDGNLVPAGPPVRISGGELKQAARNLGDVIGIMGWELYRFGKWSDSKGEFMNLGIEASNMASEAFETAAKRLGAIMNAKDPTVAYERIDLWFAKIKEVFGPEAAENYTHVKWINARMGIISSRLSKSADDVREWGGLDATPTAGLNVAMWFGSLMALFDQDKNKNISSITKYFNTFRYNVKEVSQQKDLFQAAASSFASIATSMGTIRKEINAMNFKKLKSTETLMVAMAQLSKNPDSLAQAISGSIEKAYEELANTLTELIEEIKESNKPPGEGSPPKEVTDEPGGKDNPPPGSPPQQSNTPPPPQNAGVQKVKITNLGELAALIK